MEHVSTDKNKNMIQNICNKNEGVSYTRCAFFFFVDYKNRLIFLSCDIFVLMPGRSITKTILLLALIYSVIAEGYFCFIRITGTISLNGNH